MDSQQLRALGFMTWQAFHPDHKRQLASCLPSCFGVYVIRRGTTVQRGRGMSDILYIGCATYATGLRGRISQYFSPGPTQSTNKRILALVRNSPDYYISWVETETKGQAKSLEQDLLDRYIADHGERPPENLRG